MSNTPASYIVVSPVKDEEKYVERTLLSVIAQTILPKLWVIVDDGSQDTTPQILRRYADQHSWIRIIRIDRGPQRELGVTEIRAFALGYELTRSVPHDYLVKLDCDVELPADYFERLLQEFNADQSLGIASGAYAEQDGNKWLVVKQPGYHACGASKMVRTECFRDIGGFILFRGWDTVDQIRARMRGWTTRNFEDVIFFHLKAEGSAAGHASTNIFHGHIYYLTGGSVLFLMAKAMRRGAIGKPRILSGLLMVFGYLTAACRRVPRVVSAEEARFYRHMLNKQLYERCIGGRLLKNVAAWRHA